MLILYVAKSLVSSAQHCLSFDHDSLVLYECFIVVVLFVMIK